MNQAGPSRSRVGIRFRLNGKTRQLRVDGRDSAAALLRDRLDLTGTKIACGQGVCGACTILVDGTPIVSCLLPASALDRREVVTIEGVSADDLHPVQRAFLAEDALQCGYCTPGFIVEATAFHDRWRRERGDEEPSDADIAAALSGHLCRCGAYAGILAAVRGACAGRHDVGPTESPRHDGPVKVTGAARYTVDVRYPGQLEGRILRAPYANAVIRKLDSDRARRAPGVHAVVDLTFGDREVRYAGQELLAVAARDRRAADEALHEVVLECDRREPVLDLRAARAPEAPVVYARHAATRKAPSANEGVLVPALWHGNVRGPFPFFSTIRRAGGGLRRAANQPNAAVVCDRWRTQVQSHSCLEPHACVAWWKDDELIVHLSTQAVVRMHEDIAQRWNLRRDRVRVHAEYVGGGFGSKAILGPEVVAAVELSRASGAPVRVVLDRREELAVGGCRPAQEMELSIAADERGALAGMGLTAYGDGGVAVGNVVSAMLRIVYRGAPKDLVDWDVTTHSAPATPFRAPGGPPAFWALEQAVDEIAVRRGEDPLALRRRWDTSAVRQRLYDWVEGLESWASRGPTGADAGRYRRGVGLAAGAWFHILDTETEVELRVDDGVLRAATASQDMGNGTRTALAVAVAEVFGIGPAEVEVAIGDSRAPRGPLSAGSRTTASVVPAATEAALQLRDELVVIARERLGLAGAHAVPGGVASDTGRIPWGDVIAVAPALIARGARPRDRGGYVLPFSLDGLNLGRCLSGSVQLTEVEVDTRLGRISVRRSWSGIGCGQIVAPALARSQIEGGVVQGLSYALYEERRLAPGHGSLLSASLDDYRIAGIGDVPTMVVYFDECGFESVSGGMVGLGELGTTAVAASIGNAVHHATGWRPLSLPLRPDVVLAGLADSSRAGACP